MTPKHVRAFYTAPYRGRSINFLLALASLSLILCSAIFLFLSRHWPMVGDAALMQYAVFLVRHGWVPYRDFTDVNMPGAYLLTGSAMRLLGTGDAGWRIFDLGLVAVTGAGYWWIARPLSRFAALLAGCLLLLIHGQDGVQQAGQRDLAIAALTVLGVGCLVAAWRARQARWLVPFGLALGLAGTIKPTAIPVGIVLLLLLAAAHARPGSAAGAPDGNAQDGNAQVASPAPAYAWRSALGWALAGLAAMALPLAVMVAWLAQRQALGPWLRLLRTALPYYAHMDRRPLGFTLTHSLAPLLPLVLVWLVCLAVASLEQRGEPRAQASPWNHLPRLLLAAGVLLNLGGLLLQGKSLPYQRYPMLALLLLWIALDLTAALRGTGARGRVARAIAVAAVAYASLVLAPAAVWKTSQFEARTQRYDTMLADDLDLVGGSALDGRVQCLDTIEECLPTLNTLHLRPATGTLYDIFLFGPASEPAVAAARQRFLAQVEARPPLVFVVSSGYFFNRDGGYGKLARWPEFTGWLNAHYTLRAERVPREPVRWWGRPQAPAGYRLYVSNSAPPPDKTAP